MTLVFVGIALAFAAAAGGLTLVALLLSRHRAPRALLYAHPIVGIAGLACLWVAVALWQGPRDLPFDAGALVLTFALFGGVLLFSLRSSRLPRPFFAVALHGLVALFGCALLVIGLLHVPPGAG
ncbi:MAG: hypothetical protein ACRES7_04305 [Gammaproteobacteria bacterium]